MCAIGFMVYYTLKTRAKAVGTQKEMGNKFSPLSELCTHWKITFIHTC